jgi:hypothetical protein
MGPHQGRQRHGHPIPQPLHFCQQLLCWSHLFTVLLLGSISGVFDLLLSLHTHRDATCFPGHCAETGYSHSMLRLDLNGFMGSTL